MGPTGASRGRRTKAVIGWVLAPLVAGIALVALWSAARWFQNSEADAAMFATPAPIDGRRAFDYLNQICALGPRMAGSEANARQRRLVAAHFKKHGGEVREQPFQAVHPITGERLEMANLIGSWHPERPGRVLLAAHYDTRPHPDEEDDPERRDLPFLGANDCASGVALLMEIAHHLDTLETPWGVDLVLLDGEELVYGDTPPRGEYFLGSRFFGRAYAHKAGRNGNGGGNGKRPRYVAGILFDMVGGRDLQIKREPYSLRLAPRLVREVWAVARKLDARSFRTSIGREVRDDHLPLNDAGIPTIDLIDFDYEHWHKASDLPENCSAESLAEVGRVVTAWLALPRRTRSR